MVNDNEVAKLAVHYTVDLEDFTFDLCRSLDSTALPKLRTNSLFESYHNILNLLSLTQENTSNITFFCTGIMADRYPDLIKLIVSDGHEIACHGNFHDNIYVHFHRGDTFYRSSICRYRYYRDYFSRNK